MFKTIIQILIVINLISLVKNSVDDEERLAYKMCQAKTVNDEKINLYHEEISRCHGIGDCIEQADDIKSELKDWHNKDYFAHICSKKFQECERKKSKQEQQSAKSSKKSEKERYAKIIVSIMLKWLFTFKMNLL